MMEVVKSHPDFKRYELCMESSLKLPGLEIYLDSRKIYQQVWGDYVQDIENNTIGYHICHLKEKLFAASPCSSFNIRCVRNVGYCFELLPEEDSL